MRKRIISLKAFYFDGQGIRRHCLSHLTPGETVGRILFYDALPFTGKGEHPLSGPMDFSQTPLIARKQQFLQSLRVTPEITLRLGRSAWQAGQWQLDANRLGELMAGEISVNDIEAGDIYPDIRQKGVDMLLGLDIAALAYIVYRAKKLGVNPYKQEAFVGTKDFQKAMERRADTAYLLETEPASATAAEIAEMVAYNELPAEGESGYVYVAVEKDEQ